MYTGLRIFSAYQNIKVQKIVPGCNFSVKTNRYFPKFSSRSNARVKKGKDYFAPNKRARAEIKVGLNLIGPGGYQYKILKKKKMKTTSSPSYAYLIIGDYLRESGPKIRTPYLGHF